MTQNVLFICSQNRLRSPTAEQVFSNRAGFEVASAGTDGGLPSTLFDGEASYDSTLTQVLQPSHNAIQDNDYYFTVTVPTTNAHKILTRFGLLSVRG